MAYREPGRSDLHRTVPALVFVGALLGPRSALARASKLLICIAACVWIVGCAAAGPESESATPHPVLKKLWRDYRQLPNHRALAIAGDLSRQRWVAGATGGQPSPADAEAEALRECRKQRAKKRMQDACTLYAVGNRVVWTGR